MKLMKLTGIIPSRLLISMKPTNFILIIYDLVNNIDSIIEITEIKLSYILSLDTKNHYSKANDCLREVDILIQKIKDTESFDRINERYIFAFGVIANRLGNIEESQDSFSQLIKIDPDNDNYKDWYNGNKDQLFSKKTRLIGHIGFGLFMVFLFSDLVIDYDKDLKLKLEIISFIIMFGGYYGYKIKQFLRKYKILNK